MVQLDRFLSLGGFVAQLGSLLLVLVTILGYHILAGVWLSFLLLVVAAVFAQFGLYSG